MIFYTFSILPFSNSIYLLEKDKKTFLHKIQPSEESCGF